ncbi:MAG: nitrate/TMAO reductase-like tetraheme cytochrome c subunit [Myxococcota bacterium]|jgi:nitrate/TMAO reductase-like tetraheme cytochrome c subunit
MRVLTLILALATGAPPALFSTGGERPIPLQKTPPGIATQSARACAGCHSEIYLQWKESMHSAAWNDAQFQELWRARSREQKCLHCHSPLTAQLRRIDGQPNPAFRPTLQSQGVTCAACHIRDGAVVGAGTSTTTPPHPVAVDKALAGAGMCASCHQQDVPGRTKGIYDTYREWLSTKQARAGGSCGDCHMPRVMGNVAVGVHRSYRSHGFAGAHSDEMLQRALTVTVLLDKPVHAPGESLTARVEVRNTGAAHSVPSGDPAHQIRVVAGLADSQGEFIEKVETLLARKQERDAPYRERIDTRLAPSAARTIKLQTQLPHSLGDHYLIVQLSYHLMSPEKAAELGVPESAVSRVFDTQIVPVGP